MSYFYESNKSFGLIFFATISISNENKFKFLEVENKI